MGEFETKQNEFLVFEDGPTADITLQWATYRDAADQSSLSRIWGGIHPPFDDIPGRRIGTLVAADAFEHGRALLRRGGAATAARGAPRDRLRDRRSPAGQHPGAEPAGRSPAHRPTSCAGWSAARS